jgi:transposase
LVRREWPYVHEDVRAELLRDEHLLAGVDPGKRDLVTVCDGARGPKGRYSAVQRRWEVFNKRHREQRLRLLRSAVQEDCRFHDMRRLFDPGGTEVTTY